MRRVSHYEHAFRAGRGEQVERVPHPDYPHPDGAAPPAPPPVADPIAAAEASADLGAESTEGVDAGVDAAAPASPTEALASPTAATESPDPTPAPPSDEPLDPAPLSLAFSSSNIRSATLDPSTGIVDVTFTSDKTYRYGAFSVELMIEWRAAKSAGRWFNVNIKTRPDLHPLIAPAPPAAG